MSNRDQEALGGRSRGAAHSQTCLTSFNVFSIKGFSIPLFQLGLHVGDPAVVEVDEEEAEGGGGQEPLPGKIAHQAQSFVTRQAEMMLV